MDFSVVGLDNYVRSNTRTATSNNGSFACENTAQHNNQNWYGSEFPKQKRTLNEDDLREYKVAKTSSCGDAMLKVPLRRSTDSCLTEDHQQMLSFSSPNSQTSALSYYHHTTSAFRRNIGFGSSGMNSTDMLGLMSGIRGPFTPSQWMELEHQALIYKYIIANVPIPSYLLNPIRKALESAGFSGFSGLRSNALGWGGFRSGFSNTDPEPGRCRRTDGKKWRCSRDAVADQKYCERHMNRGRHRSRKPVEGRTASGICTTKANQSLASQDNADGGYQNTTIFSATSPKGNHKDKNIYDESCRTEFGLVCYDSLLNPLDSSSSLVNCRPENLNNHQNDSQQAFRQFIDEWPKTQSQHHSITSDLMSSTSSPTNAKLIRTSPQRLSRELEATQMGLGVGNCTIEQSQKQTSWVPTSWETSTGGPLGEVLHTTGEFKRAKALNFIESWNNNSSHGAFQRNAVVSLSNGSAGSSVSSGFIASGLISSSFPAL